MKRLNGRAITLLVADALSPYENAHIADGERYAVEVQRLSRAAFKLNPNVLINPIDRSRLSRLVNQAAPVYRLGAAERSAVRAAVLRTLTAQYVADHRPEGFFPGRVVGSAPHWCEIDISWLEVYGAAA